MPNGEIKIPNLSRIYLFSFNVHCHHLAYLNSCQWYHPFKQIASRFLTITCHQLSSAQWFDAISHVQKLTHIKCDWISCTPLNHNRDGYCRAVESNYRDYCDYCQQLDHISICTTWRISKLCIKEILNFSEIGLPEHTQCCSATTKAAMENQQGKLIHAHTNDNQNPILTFCNISLSFSVRQPESNNIGKRCWDIKSPFLFWRNKKCFKKISSSFSRKKKLFFRGFRIFGLYQMISSSPKNIVEVRSLHSKILLHLNILANRFLRFLLNFILTSSHFLLFPFRRVFLLVSLSYLHHQRRLNDATVLSSKHENGISRKFSLTIPSLLCHFPLTKQFCVCLEDWRWSCCHRWVDFHCCDGWKCDSDAIRRKFDEEKAESGRESFLSKFLSACCWRLAGEERGKVSSDDVCNHFVIFIVSRSASGCYGGREASLCGKVGELCKYTFGRLEFSLVCERPQMHQREVPIQLSLLLCNYTLAFAEVFECLLTTPSSLLPCLYPEYRLSSCNNENSLLLLRKKFWNWKWASVR